MLCSTCNKVPPVSCRLTGCPWGPWNAEAGSTLKQAMCSAGLSDALVETTSWPEMPSAVQAPDGRWGWPDVVTYELFDGTESIVPPTPASHPWTPPKEAFGRQTDAIAGLSTSQPFSVIIAPKMLAVFELLIATGALHDPRHTGAARTDRHAHGGEPRWFVVRRGFKGRRYEISSMMGARPDPKADTTIEAVRELKGEFYDANLADLITAWLAGRLDDPKPAAKPAIDGFAGIGTDWPV